MRKRRNNQPITPFERATSVAEIVLPCYAGPYDGKFYRKSCPPIGYRVFPIRGRHVFLWGAVKIEKLDFNIVDRASRTTMQDEEFGKDE